MISTFCIFMIDLRVWWSLYWPDPCAAELCRGLDRWEMGREGGWTTMHWKTDVLKRQTELLQVPHFNAQRRVKDLPDSKQSAFKSFNAFVNSDSTDSNDFIAHLPMETMYHVLSLFVHV